MKAREKPKEDRDPLIEEVRLVRKMISDQFDNDVDRLCIHLKELEAQNLDRVARSTRKAKDQERL